MTKKKHRNDREYEYDYEYDYGYDDRYELESDWEYDYAPTGDTRFFPGGGVGPFTPPRPPVPQQNLPFQPFPLTPPGGAFPGQQGPVGGSAVGAPPNFIPNKAQAVDLPGPGAVGIPGAPGAQGFGPGGVTSYAAAADLRRCLYRWVYIWQNNGDSYWLYLMNVRRRSIVGYRWIGHTTVWFGVDPRRIDAFYCAL